MCILLFFHNRIGLGRHQGPGRGQSRGTRVGRANEEVPKATVSLLPLVCVHPSRGRPVPPGMQFVRVRALPQLQPMRWGPPERRAWPSPAREEGNRAVSRRLEHGRRVPPVWRGSLRRIEERGERRARRCLRGRRVHHDGSGYLRHRRPCPDERLLHRTSRSGRTAAPGRHHRVAVVSPGRAAGKHSL